MKRSLSIVALLFAFLVGIASSINAGELPDYTNWSNKFSVTSKMSFEGIQLDAEITMYFNHAVPREASQIIADIATNIGGHAQRYVQYIAIQNKDIAANFVNFDVELYQAVADKMLFRGATNLTMSIEEFYQNMMLLSPQPTEGHGY